MTRPIPDLLRDLDRRIALDCPLPMVPVGLLRECREALAAAEERGRSEERERIVAFVREWDAFPFLADAIERAAHAEAPDAGEGVDRG